MAQDAKILELDFGSDSKNFLRVFLNGSLPEIIRGLTTGICAQTSCFLKAAVLHYFPSGGLLDAAVLRCCLFPVHFSRSATSIELAFGSNSDACYAAFLRSLTETLRGLNSCICAQTSCFL